MVGEKNGHLGSGAPGKGFHKALIHQHAREHHTHYFIPVIERRGGAQEDAVFPLGHPAATFALEGRFDERVTGDIHANGFRGVDPHRDDAFPVGNGENIKPRVPHLETGQPG